MSGQGRDEFKISRAQPVMLPCRENIVASNVKQNLRRKRTFTLKDFVVALYITEVSKDLSQTDQFREQSVKPVQIIVHGIQNFLQCFDGCYKDQ